MNINRFKLAIDIAESINDNIAKEFRGDLEHILEAISPYMEKFIREIEDTLTKDFRSN